MKKRYNYTLSDETVALLKEISVKSGLKMTTIIEKAIKYFDKNKKYEDE